jgi:hypothetical protein
MLDIRSSRSKVAPTVEEELKKEIEYAASTRLARAISFYAAIYASESTIAFLNDFIPEAYDSSPSLKEDINLDGSVNSLDVQLCINVLTGRETDADIVKRADVNGNGVVDSADVQLCIEHILGLSNPLLTGRSNVSLDGEVNILGVQSILRKHK